jgi:hypothetical protein
LRQCGRLRHRRGGAHQPDRLAAEEVLNPASQFVRERHFSDSRFDGNLRARPIGVTQCPFGDTVILLIGLVLLRH